MSTLIRRKWTRVAFQGSFPVLLRRHVSQAAHGAFFVEELDIARDRGGDVLGVADAEADEHLRLRPAVDRLRRPVVGGRAYTGIVLVISWGRSILLNASDEYTER